MSPTSEGLRAVLARASADARFDFGGSHFAARLEDSLELKSETRAVNDVTLVELFGLRSGDRTFSAKFFGAWLDDSAFLVNETTLTVRDARGQPDGLGTVFDASALGVANPTSATGHAV